MSANEDILGQLQADIAATLSESPAMGGARVLVDGDKDFQSRLERELGTMTGDANGKRGLVIIVAPIAIDEVERNLPGPTCKLACRVVVLENLSINRSPTYGSGMPATLAALNVLRALHLRSFGSHCLHGGKGAVIPDKAPDGFNAYLVKLEAQLESEPPAKVDQVSVSVAGEDIALACATSGAEIRYTTDGAFPSSSATLYTAPITGLETGDMIRAAGYKAQMEPSDVLQFTITAS